MEARPRKQKAATGLAKCNFAGKCVPQYNLGTRG